MRADVCTLLTLLQTTLMTEAAKCLALAESGAKNQAQAAKAQSTSAGLEWDVLR